MQECVEQLRERLVLAYPKQRKSSLSGSIDQKAGERRQATPQQLANIVGTSQILRDLIDLFAGMWVAKNVLLGLATIRPHNAKRAWRCCAGDARQSFREDVNWLAKGQVMLLEGRRERRGRYQAVLSR